MLPHCPVSLLCLRPRPIPNHVSLYETNPNAITWSLQDRTAHLRGRPSHDKNIQSSAGRNGPSRQDMRLLLPSHDAHRTWEPTRVSRMGPGPSIPCASILGLHLTERERRWTAAREPGGGATFCPDSLGAETVQDPSVLLCCSKGSHLRATDRQLSLQVHLVRRRRRLVDDPPSVIDTDPGLCAVCCVCIDVCMVHAGWFISPQPAAGHLTSMMPAQWVGCNLRQKPG